MATTLKTKNSVTAASAPSSLAQGELAVNITDKKLWVGNAATTPVQLLGAGVTGDVVGPASATDNALARFDATTGKLIQNSVGILSDAGALTGITDFTYTGTLTGGTGVVNLGSGQFYKTADGKVGIGTTSPSNQFAVSNAGAMGLEIVPTGGVVSAPALYSYNRSGAAWAALTYYANYHVFGVSGTTEAMRIDTSGNVLIGNTTSDGKLTLNQSNGAYLSVQYNGTSKGYFGTGNQIVTGGGISDCGISTAGSGNLLFASNGTERMRIDSSGNVGIGTSSPVQKLVVSNGGATGIEFNPTTGNIFTFNRSTVAYSDMVITSNNTIFQTGGGTERMRIDSSGNLLVGTTSGASFRQRLYCNGFTNNGIVIATTDNASGFIYAAFKDQTDTTIGSITRVGTTSVVSYATSSDYRLKENIVPMTGALEKVALLKPVTYKWKADGSDGQGFVAHELAEIVPDCVTGEKDAVDAEGKPQYQGIDVSFLVATLTAAIQEQQAIIENLTTRLTALENK